MTLSQAHAIAQKYRTIAMCVYTHSHGNGDTTNHAVNLKTFRERAEINPDRGDTLIAVYPVIKITQYKDTPPDKPLYLSDISYKYWGTS